jgi:hypothetical protein
MSIPFEYIFENFIDRLKVLSSKASMNLARAGRRKEGAEGACREG